MDATGARSESSRGSPPSSARYPATTGENGDPGELGRRLLDHFDHHRRDLPWRGEGDPYRIWVSETMLQQTRVETVLRYYGRWMERFPSLASLAEAPEDEVLLLWEGLGYYARARRLQQAARVVRDRFGGTLPRTPEALRTLPGVGDYTAGALASIAFGVRAAAVDGNVRRVICRLFDLAEPSPATLRELALALQAPERPGDSNQALMELGATVCTPRSPRCGICPVQRGCLAHGRGTVARRPRRATRRRLPQKRFALVVLALHDARVLVERRQTEGLLAGLWAFPEALLADGEDPVEATLTRASQLGFRVGAGLPLSPVSHAFTHLRALYLPVLYLLEGSPPAPPGTRWVASSGGREVALPAAQRRTLSLARGALSGMTLGRSRGARSTPPQHGPQHEDPRAP